MNFLKKIFGKRQPSSSDGIKVILETNKELSEEQRNTIIDIVTNGIISGKENSDIGIIIMMTTGIDCGEMVLNRTKNYIKVIF